MPWGSIVSAAIGAGSSLLGGYMSNRAKSQANQLDIDWARESQQKDQDFQREVYQNQYQWKAADAKRAGLHPLAIIGGGSYSASPTSQPVNIQPNDYSFLGKMGEHIGDAAMAYMNRDQIAEAKARSDAEWNKRMEALDAQIGEIRARTQESINRSMSYTKPLATGSEFMAGQTDSGPTPSGIVKSHPTYVVRDMGNGLYDINFSTDYQQEIGDELGQLVNFYHQGKRHLGNRWRDPRTGIIYYRVPEQGLWVRGHKVGYSNDRRSAYGHLRFD